MNCWMKRLAKQHRMMRTRHPHEHLAVVFDIDDTILDLRHMILNVFASFDRAHGTKYFRGLALHDIIVGETEIERIIEEARIPVRARRKVAQWFVEQAWSNPVVAWAHRPFEGVVEVIRWLQSQERTCVGLNTGRPEEIRAETLLSLNRIGRAHGVRFYDDLLFMSHYAWGERIPESKVEGIRYFQQQGLRVAAFVDNEPENLHSVAKYDGARDILLLHADTVYRSEREVLPAHAVSGTAYDVSRLARGHARKHELGKAA